MTRKITSSSSSAVPPSGEAPPTAVINSLRSPSRAWLEESSARQGNQDDAGSDHRDNQSDSSERDAWVRAKPTTLEELLDMELDVHRASEAASDSRRAQSSGNQAAPDELSFADSSALSLELLALQSPHGESQQWEDDPAFLARDALFEPNAVPAGVPQLKRASSTASSDGTADLVSPSRHVAAFSLSPAHAASGDEFDLISPIALPESPAPQTRVPSWDHLPELVLDDTIGWGSSGMSTESKARSKSASTSWPLRPRHRSSASPPRSTATTKSPPRSVYLERKPKAKHGGIYSLLLKYKSPEQAPVLVDDLQSPDLAFPATQSTNHPRSPPPSVDKPQHGGIYRVLRRASSQR